MGAARRRRGRPHRDARRGRGRRRLDSSLETFQPTLIALAADAAGQAWAAVQHGSELELAHALPGAAWDRLDLGAVDVAQPDLSIAPNGEARVCFHRGGRLLLY